MSRELKFGARNSGRGLAPLYDSGTVNEDKATIGVPTPQLLREPDRTGCNRTMMYFQNASAYRNECAAAILQVQQKWNLRED
jgi:hypothetical protein